MGKLGVFLKLCRENLGLTQDQVAEKLHVDRSTYSYYELKRVPSTETLLKLSAIYRVPIDEFFKCVASDGENLKFFDYDLQQPQENTDYQPKIPDKFYDLSKEEKALLLSFRTLSDDDKKALLENLSSN